MAEQDPGLDPPMRDLSQPAGAPVQDFGRRLPAAALAQAFCQRRPLIAGYVAPSLRHERRIYRLAVGSGKRSVVSFELSHATPCRPTQGR
jgi:hypothetical protein